MLDQPIWAAGAYSNCYNMSYSLAIAKLKVILLHFLNHCVTVNNNKPRVNRIVMVSPQM